MSLLDDSGLQKSILSIPGWLSMEEGLALYKLAKHACRRGPVVEIGSYQGKSTIFMAQALFEEKTGKIFAIDPHLGIRGENHPKEKPTFKSFLINIKRFGVNKYVIPIRKTSQEASKNWHRKISLLFVDGLHEYKYVKQDLGLWLKYLDKRGIVVCHDAFTPYPGIFEAVNEEILNSGKFNKLTFINSAVIAMKGKKGHLNDLLFFHWNKLFMLIIISIWQSPFIPNNISNSLVVLLKKFIWKNIL